MTSLRTAFTAFRRAPLLSALSITTIAFSLFAFGLFGLVALNIKNALPAVEERVEIRAFVADSTTVEEIADARRRDREVSRSAQGRHRHAGRRRSSARSKELGEFKDVFESRVPPGVARREAQAGHSAIRRPFEASPTSLHEHRLRRRRSLRRGVDHAALSAAQHRRRRRRALGLAFAAVAVIIIGATIRMAVLARSREISIMRLVGATDGFIRRPFLIEGSIKGVLGGVLALVLTYIAMRMLEQYLHFETVFFDRRLALLGILFGAVMGLLRQRGVGRPASAAGMTDLARRRRRCALSARCSALSRRAPARASAQDARIRAQRDTLERIRREREALERRAAELQNTVHDLDEEVTNLDRARRRHGAPRAERSTTSSRRSTTRPSRVDQERGDRGERARRRSETRCTRGSSTSTSAARCSRREAMLSARSFGELVARYKYLHLLALHDRALVTRVEQLHDRVHARTRPTGRAAQTRSRRIAATRRARRSGFARSSTSARRASSRTRAAGESRRRTGSLRIKATEAQFTNVIARSTRTAVALESDAARTRRATRARSRRATTASSIGRWTAPLVYTFGKAQTASNTTIRWNGVGIKRGGRHERAPPWRRAAS